MSYIIFFRLAARVVKRSVILFALGIMINSIGGNNDFRTFRIPGLNFCQISKKPKECS